MVNKNDVHIEIYELTCRINKLLTLNKVEELGEVLEKRKVFIALLEKASPPQASLSKKIIELENKNKSLMEKIIQEQKQTINDLQSAKKTLTKYKVSKKSGKLLNLKR